MDHAQSIAIPGRAMADATGPAQPSALSADRTKEIILARIASGTGTISRDAAAHDLAFLAGASTAAKTWRATFDRAGLLHILGAHLEITDAGRLRAQMLIGGKGPWPKTWSELLATRLMAKSLDLVSEPANRLKLLAKPDGLRAAILQQAFGVKIKGVPTASRVRSALAIVALERAFGNKIRAGVQGKTGLSAKAGRTLASQLALSQRAFGTDSRLVSALAAEQVGADDTDIVSLQAALLRRYVTGTMAAPVAAKSAKPKRTTQRKTRPKTALPAAPADTDTEQNSMPSTTLAAVATAAASGLEHASRPDLPAFASAVRSHAAERATGWPGNRKAFISHVWSTVQTTRAEWGLTEIEFKCMLAEAHRAGHVVLAHADLKDAATIKDVQASAVSFKNAVFHFVRVDD
jgi:hypothetical protein